MKQVVRFAVVLLAAIVGHLAIVRLVPQAARFVDLFLVAALYHALSASPVAGMFYGMVAGLTADAVSGGPYGLYGIAGTLAGFAAGTISQLVVIQRSTGAFGLFAAGSAVQQAALVVVALLALPSPVLPDGLSIAGRTLCTGVLGMFSFELARYVRRRFALWRQGRPSKIRWGR